MSFAKSWRRMGRNLVGVLLMLSSGTVAYIGASAWRMGGAEPGAISRDPEVAEDSLPKNPFPHGTYLIAYVLASSDCGWSTLPTTMNAVGGIREGLQAAYGSAYAQVNVVGVSIDPDLKAGLQFLSDIGEGRPQPAFDQISVGGSWLNEQIVQLVWQDAVAEPIVPQVVVLERPVDSQGYLATGALSLDSDRVLLDLMGTAEITQWIREGLPLDWRPYRGPESG